MIYTAFQNIRSLVYITKLNIQNKLGLLFLGCASVWMFLFKWWREENTEISDSQFIRIEIGFKLLWVSSFDRLISFSSTRKFVMFSKDSIAWFNSDFKQNSTTTRTFPIK